MKKFFVCMLIFFKPTPGLCSSPQVLCSDFIKNLYCTLKIRQLESPKKPHSLKEMEVINRLQQLRKSIYF